MIPSMIIRKNSRIIGCIHNSIQTRKFISNILLKENYDYYLIELNKQNYDFIKKNNFHYSEFYDIITTIPNSKVKLIDMNYEREISLYSNSKNVYNDIINYEYDKYILYKLFDEVYDLNLIEKLKIYQCHIKQREDYMIKKIQEYNKYKILILVGKYHYEYILNKLFI